jgi:hypothetical protein
VVWLHLIQDCIKYLEYKFSVEPFLINKGRSSAYHDHCSNKLQFSYPSIF